MNKKLLSKILVSLSFTGLLCLNACTQESSTTSSVESSEVIKNKSNLKTLMKLLNSTKNYTITSEEGYFKEYDYVFTPSSIGLVSLTTPSMDSIYYQDGDNGVYSIGYNGEKFVGSEYYSNKSKNVWSNEYLYSLYNVSTSFVEGISSSVSTLSITDKKYKIGFIQTLGYSATDLINLQSLDATYVEDDTEAKISFKMVYKNTPFYYTAHKFGFTTNTVVDKYLANNGTVFTPTATQSRIREAMRLNNYTQWIYQFGDSEETTGYVGTACYTPNYFYTHYNGYSYIEGYIGLDKPNYSRYGCYKFIMSESKDQDQQTVVSYQDISTPLFSTPDIPLFMHYPSYLGILDHLEYLNNWSFKYFSNSEYTPVGKGYVVTDLTFLSDFASNFSLNDQDSFMYGHTPISLGIDYIPASNSTYETIVFVYKFYLNGYTYVFPMPFSNFGTSNLSYLEQILAA